MDRLMPLPAGSYYHHDLVGCRVETAGGRPICVVTSVDKYAPISIATLAESLGARSFSS